MMAAMVFASGLISSVGRREQDEKAPSPVWGATIYASVIFREDGVGNSVCS